jgi:large subunit ribosomal protein L14
MLLKQSWIHISDNTNVRWLRLFHLYKGFNRRSTTIGFFVKGSATVVEPPRLEYKGFKFKFNKKGDICRAILVRCTKPLYRLDGSITLFPHNTAILIKKKQNIKSKYINGPATYHLRRKKFKAVYRQLL